MIAVFALVAAASEVETKKAVAYVLGYAGALIVFGGLMPPTVWNGLS
jgi:nitrate reductase gamma subunit